MSPVTSSIARGLAFLEQSQGRDGGFVTLMSTDPQMATGCAPDPAIFPVALIAQALAGVPEARDVHGRALDFLAAEMAPLGLWRHWTREHPHHRRLPPDVDDTACAAQALLAAGRPVPANQTILFGNLDRAGRLRTWIIPRAESAAISAQWRAATPQLQHALIQHLFFKHTSAERGDVDAVVNANALFYLGDAPQTVSMAAWLAAVLERGEEAICDKWYENPFAVWYFFARALAPLRPDLGALASAKIRAACPSNAMEAAMAVSALANWGEPIEELLVEDLMARQTPSGAWPVAALYHGGRARRPEGGFHDPHPDTPRWGSQALTTALCLEALSRWRSMAPA
jgi:hypothetical protein